MSLLKFVAPLLAAATLSQAVGETFSRPLQAQAFGEVPESFPIPDSLPDGTTLKVDGSTSMQLTNEVLEGRFETQYPNVDVELDASRTDEAFRALIDGDIDVLASGRPLTDAEKAQGVVEVPLEQREKLAIIVGPENTFDGDLTFEQFAQIFRGEITNWSEVGGPNLPIRFVDRPDYSDTRHALGTYSVFEGKPFVTGQTATPVDDDETDTVIKALGKDGLGYAVVSQVKDRDDVRIIPMHKTLPTDPRYPYSQYRSFVYKADADAATLAFLGFATTAPGQEVIGAAPEAETVPPATAEPAVEPAVEPAAEPSTDPTADPAAAAEGGFPWWILPLLAIPLLGWLLWWLLGKGSAPAGAAGAVAEGADPARLVLTPRDSQNAYAYWEVPPERLAEAKRQGGKDITLRMYDVTGRPAQGPLPEPVAEYPCIEGNPDLHVPIQAADRSYCAELGYRGDDKTWFPIVKSNPVRVPMQPSVDQASAAGQGPNLGAVALGGAALAGAAAVGTSKLKAGKRADLAPGDQVNAPQKAAVNADLDLIAKHPGKLALAASDGKRIKAQWKIPPESLAAARRQGGDTMVAKLYDVTGGYQPGDTLPEPAALVKCSDQDVDVEFAVPAADRDYLASVGYQTPEGNWLSLAQSKPVRVAAAKAPSTAGLAGAAAAGAAAAGATTAGAAAAGAAAAGTVAAGAAAAGAAAGDNGHQATPGEPETIGAASISASHIELSLQSPQKAYAAWNVPETAKTALKAEGGRDYQLRVHDVTGIDINQRSPHGTLAYGLADIDCDRTVPLPSGDSEYLAEVGYQTASGEWLMLARSETVKPLPAATSKAAGAVALGAVGAAASGLAKSPGATKGQGTSQIVKVHSRKNALLFDAQQAHNIENVASTYHLSPGLYSLKLRDGVFNYDRDHSHPGEPFVMLWIHGGTVINPETGIPISSTWTTLNGYDDTLTLTVREPATLCAFYVDTYPDDNMGEVTLTIAKHGENN